MFGSKSFPWKMDRTRVRWMERRKSIVQLSMLLAMVVVQVGMLLWWDQHSGDAKNLEWWNEQSWTRMSRRRNGEAGHAEDGGKGLWKGKPWEANIRIEVIANKRLPSLQRLLTSLVQANFVGATVPLDIHLEAQEPEELLRYVVQFEWPFGPKQVHLRQSKGGLINAVLESWYPASMEEMAVILEDDVEVSPFFFLWILGILKQFKGSSSVDPRFVGISLYTPRVGELKLPRPRYNFTSLLLENDDVERKVFRFQLPCSWGALYFAQFWMELRDYVSVRLREGGEAGRFVIPGSRSRGWSDSWKKFAIELFWSKGYYLVYPNLPKQSSFSTNHLEVGKHIGGSSKTHLPIDYTVPLVADASVLSSTLMWSSKTRLESLPLLDIFGSPYRNWNHTRDMLLSGIVPESKLHTASCTEKMRSKLCQRYNWDIHERVQGTDKFTVVLSHFWKPERAKILVELVTHYARSTLVEKVFVVWHNVAAPCPTATTVMATPIKFVRQTCDSLNNRFLVDMQITTEAVFIVDDDIQVHLQDLAMLFASWQQYSSHVVGFFPRWFQPLSSSRGLYVQKMHKLDHDLGYSFMLTKAMMVQSRYLFEYRCGLGVPMHPIVDLHTNAEDLAFNLMMRKLLGWIPAMFVQPEWPVLDYGTYVAGGLHKRSKIHDAARSHCLNQFMAILGLTSWDLCCVGKVIEGQREWPTYSFKQKSFKEIVAYVYNPCKDVNSTSQCRFVPQESLDEVVGSNILQI